MFVKCESSRWTRMFSGFEAYLKTFRLPFCNSVPSLGQFVGFHPYPVNDDASGRSVSSGSKQDASTDESSQGESLLRRYVLEIARDSEHYDTALELLSSIGPKIKVFEAAKALLAAGVALNVKNERGRHPLRYADDQGHTGAAAVLRAHGAKK